MVLLSLQISKDGAQIPDQNGADIERVREVQRRLPTVYLPLEAGDAVFFHCNLLHSTDQNLSSRRRWALLSCYSRADNGPFKKVVVVFFSLKYPTGTRKRKKSRRRGDDSYI